MRVLLQTNRSKREVGIINIEFHLFTCLERTGITPINMDLLLLSLKMAWPVLLSFKKILAMRLFHFLTLLERLWVGPTRQIIIERVGKIIMTAF